MRRPTRTRTTTTTAVAAAAVFVAVAVLTPAGAEAVKMITGKDIKNNSITSSDVKDGSLLAGDFKPGQLVAGAPGPIGPTGATGAQGVKGDPGASAPEPTVAEWNFGATSTGQPVRLTGTSTMTIPAFNRANGVNLDVTGDFSSCNSFGGVTVLITDNGLASRYVDQAGGSGGLQSLSLSQANVGPEPLKLTWIADCYANTTNGNGPVPVPSFTAKLIFDYTPVNSTPARTFQ